MSAANGDPLLALKYALQRCNIAVALYDADRWRWLPWRSFRHYFRLRDARRALRLERARAGLL